MIIITSLLFVMFNVVVVILFQISLITIFFKFDLFFVAMIEKESKNDMSLIDVFRQCISN